MNLNPLFGILLFVSVHIGVLHIVVIIHKKSQERSANNKSTIYRPACLCDVIDSGVLTLFNEPGEIYLHNSDVNAVKLSYP